MADDTGKIPPGLGRSRPGRGRSLRGLWTAAGLAAGAALVAFLVWRVTAAALGSPRPADARAGASGPRGDRQPPDQGGAGTGVIVKEFDPAGRISLVVHAETATLSGALCRMKTVELRRHLGKGKGDLVANGRRGVYNRTTGSGTLEGNVVVRRFLPGRKEPDAVIRTAELAWNQAAGRLTSPVYAEITWNDPKTGRKLVAGGIDMVAEQWAQTVRFGHDVRVSIAEPALPARLPLGPTPAAGGPKGPSVPTVTVVTCSGPASFENHTGLDGRRIIFNREVQANRQDLQLNCDRLEVLLCPEGAGPAPEGTDLSAVRLAAAGPLPVNDAARFLARAMAAAPEPPEPGEPPEHSQVDAVTARGAVTLRGPDGTARGEFAYYDRPAGYLWLDGAPGESAEVMRGENQMLAPSFFFNLRTEEVSKQGQGRARVIVRDKEKGKARP